MLLFDSHCHLQDKRIYAEIENVIRRAKHAGLKKILCCGSSEQDWQKVLVIARKYAGLIIPAFGLHPWYIDKRSSQWAGKLEQLLVDNPDAVVGEIGLDHVVKEYMADDQAQVFTAQIRLASGLNRPVSVHCRGAWGDLLTILRNENGIPRGGAVHSYSGSPELVEPIRKYGLSISFSGSVTYDKNKRVQRSVMAVAAEHLLVETDSPDISPVNYTGDNEPCNLVSIVKRVAELRGITAEEAGEMTYKNGMRVFGNGGG